MHGISHPSAVSLHVHPKILSLCYLLLYLHLPSHPPSLFSRVNPALFFPPLVFGFLHQLYHLAWFTPLCRFLPFHPILSSFANTFVHLCMSKSLSCAFVALLSFAVSFFPFNCLLCFTVSRRHDFDFALQPYLFFTRSTHGKYVKTYYNSHDFKESNAHHCTYCATSAWHAWCSHLQPSDKRSRHEKSPKSHQMRLFTQLPRMCAKSVVCKAICFD